jgi:glucose-1-phosphate adenylyltransferase
MKILALVLAGGEGTRLQPLTAEHAKPALPFANGYRICDFVLSNLVNSGLTSIYVIGQYKPQSLVRHIEGAWKPLLYRRNGFVRVLLPRPDVGCGYYRGTADAVCQNLHLIERHRPDLVAVFAADHVYRMDVGQMVSFHRSRAAEVTVAAVPVPISKASAFGVIATGHDGEIREFQEKPERPAPTPGHPGQVYASMGNYLFDPGVLTWLLKAAERRGATDFGHDILPRLPGAARVHAYNFGGNYVPGVRPYEEPAYWRDVGTLDALAAAQADVVGPTPRFDLANARWPIHGARAPLAVRIRARSEPARAIAALQLAPAGRDERQALRN